MLCIKLTQEFGRGVYTDRFIQAGETIEVAEVLVLSSTDTVRVNETDLKWYTFAFADNRDCLVLGNGELYNHSDDANVSYNLVFHAERPQMVFVAIRDIQAGQQLFTNYSQDVAVDSKQYTDIKYILESGE